MATQLKVAILDDHQSTLDGYLYRLNSDDNIVIVATASYGEELEHILEENTVDLLILDVSVPTSAENPNPYPLLHHIPYILQHYPEIAILIITMHNQRSLIRALMKAGVSGYILKDDRESIRKLPEIISTVSTGGIYFSEQSYRAFMDEDSGSKAHLTQRQCEVLSLVASRPNTTTADLARKLHVAPSTVRNLLSEAYVRLKVNNKTAAIIKAREMGFITPFPATPE